MALPLHCQRSLWVPTGELPGAHVGHEESAAVHGACCVLLQLHDSPHLQVTSALSVAAVAWAVPLVPRS